MTQITYRLARPEERPAISVGFAKSYRWARPMAEWNHCFGDAPQGALHVIGETEDHRIVAHYGVVLHRAVWRGRPCMTAVGTDVFTHPAWRGGVSRLFLDLAKATLQILDAEALFIAGEPTVRVFRLGTLKLGYRSLEERVCRLRVGLVPLPGGEGGDVREIAGFDSGFDALWQHRQSAMPLAVCRDAAFLSWRFAGKDYWRFAIYDDLAPYPAGYLVFRHQGNEASLADVCLPGCRSSLLRLWRTATRILAWRGIGAVSTWLSDNHPDLPALLQLGFVVQPEHERPNILGFRPFSATDPEAAYRDFCFSPADSDLD